MGCFCVFCPYAEEFDDGEVCPHTGREHCIQPELCPMIETGYATVEYYEDED